MSGNVGAMCYDVGMNTRVEDAEQQVNREHVAARQARARAHTERTSRYGQEPDHGEH